MYKIDEFVQNVNEEELTKTKEVEAVEILPHVLTEEEVKDILADIDKLEF